LKYFKDFQSRFSHACSRMSESRSGLAPLLKKQVIWCGLMRKIADILEILALPKFHIGGPLSTKQKVGRLRRPNERGLLGALELEHACFSVRVGQSTSFFSQNR